MEHHGNSHFYVPENWPLTSKKGQGVLCEAMRGLDYGTTTTGVINGDGALDVALRNGAYLQSPSLDLSMTFYGTPLLMNREAVREIWTTARQHSILGGESMTRHYTDKEINELLKQLTGNNR